MDLAIALLPGLDGTGLLFGPFLDARPTDVRVSVVTYPPDRFLSKAEVVDEAARQIPRDRDVVLVAESFSGPIAAELLRRRPPNVRGAVFAASFLSPPRPVLLKIAGLLPARAFAGARATIWLRKRLALGWDVSPETYRLFQQAQRTVAPAVLAGRLRILRDLKPPPDPIDLPACYIQAARDRLVPARCADDYRAAFPNLHFARLDGPHLILQARPRDCWRVVSEFLRSLGR